MNNTHFELLQVPGLLEFLLYVGTGIKYQKPLEMSGMLKQAKSGCGFLRDWNYNWKNVNIYIYIYFGADSGQVEL